MEPQGEAIMSSWGSWLQEKWRRAVEASASEHGGRLGHEFNVRSFGMFLTGVKGSS